MKSGYEIFWTENALLELNETYQYLKENFSNTEIEKLSNKIELIQRLISSNPKLFPFSEFKGVRRAVVKKFNTLYYRIKDERIEVLSFYNNRKDSKKRKLK